MIELSKILLEIKLIFKGSLLNKVENTGNIIPILKISKIIAIKVNKMKREIFNFALAKKRFSILIIANI